METKTFGERIRALRLARGLSMRQMAEDLKEYGVSIQHGAISKWENSNDPILPRRKTIAALAKFFNVQPSYLIVDLLTKQQQRTPGQRELEGLNLLTDDEFMAVNRLVELFVEAKMKRADEDARKPIEERRAL